MSIRTITRKFLIPILEEKPHKMSQIWKLVKKNHKKLCDDSVKCTCGNRSSKSPEWMHQVRWGVQDLKYHGWVELDKETGKYFITQNYKKFNKFI